MLKNLANYLPHYLKKLSQSRLVYRDCIVLTEIITVKLALVVTSLRWTTSSVVQMTLVQRCDHILHFEPQKKIKSLLEPSGSSAWSLF